MISEYETNNLVLQQILLIGNDVIECQKGRSTTWTGNVASKWVLIEDQVLRLVQRAPSIRPPLLGQSLEIVGLFAKGCKGPQVLGWQRSVLKARRAQSRLCTQHQGACTLFTFTFFRAIDIAISR